MKKNWIKKTGAAVLGLILTGSLLAGCGSGSGTTSQGADEPQAQETEAVQENEQYVSSKRNQKSIEKKDCYIRNYFCNCLFRKIIFYSAFSKLNLFLTGFDSGF